MVLREGGRPTQKSGEPVEAPGTLTAEPIKVGEGATIGERRARRRDARAREVSGGEWLRGQSGGVNASDEKDFTAESPCITR